MSTKTGGLHKWLAPAPLLVGLVWIGSASSTPVSLRGAVTFKTSATQQQYVVPVGVRVIAISALGGNGGQDPAAAGSEPPQGAALNVYLPVVPGQRFYVDVGANGTTGANATVGGGGAGAGGGSYPSGAGGGASDVRSSPSLASRLVVAAGAGGDPGGGNATDCAGWDLYAANATSYGQPGAPTPVKLAAGTVYPGSNSPSSAPATPAGGGGATAAGNGGAVEVCTLPDGHQASGSVAGSAASGPSGGAGGGVNSGAGSGGGGGGGYFGGGGAGGDTEAPCSGACFHSGGQGGAAGSNFVTASALSWSAYARTGTYKLTTTSLPTVTIQPVIQVDTRRSGAVYVQGRVVKASWSCAQFVTAVGDHQVCSSVVPSGSPLDTKTVGNHPYTIQDGAVSATVDYAVVASCSGLSAGSLLRCKVQGTYFTALAGCGPVTGKARVACTAKAAAAYKKSLAKIK